jgi:hypothetical protein
MTSRTGGSDYPHSESTFPQSRKILAGAGRNNYSLGGYFMDVHLNNSPNVDAARALLVGSSLFTPQSMLKQTDSDVNAARPSIYLFNYSPYANGT